MSVLARLILPAALLAQAAADDFVTIRKAQEISGKSQALSAGNGLAGSGFSAGFNSGLRSIANGEYKENHKAWGDLPGSRFIKVPDWLTGTPAYVPSHRIPGEMFVEFHCPEKSQIEYNRFEICDALVFLFRCPPCKTERGNLERQLVAEGWTVSSCAMEFKTGAMQGNGYAHKMLVLRKQVRENEKISFTTGDSAIEFITFGLSVKGVECETRKTKIDCNAASEAHHGACMWDYVEESCKHTKYCRRGAGPFSKVLGGGPGCQICPKEELEIPR